MNNIPAIIRSASDPESVSMFVKSLVSLLLLAGLDQAVVNEGGGYLTNLIVGLGMLASSATGLYGLFRKAKLGRWNA